MSGHPIFSSVMWTPSDKNGPLVTRRRGSGTSNHAVRGTQPRSASRRSSVDARACGAPRPTRTASVNVLGLPAEPERAAKSVRWLLDEYKLGTDERREINPRMPVPVSVKKSTIKPVLNPPACRPFRLLDLPAYELDDVRNELNDRILKTLNDVVPLGQTYPIMTPAASYVQYELYKLAHELADITWNRLNYIADSIPHVLRRIRRLTNNVIALSTRPTPGDADRLQALADAARAIRKTQA